MEVGAERCGPRVTRSDDPRITQLGRVLRRLKLDEIPQLINVLKGEMSVVGPRPEDPKYVAHYDEEHRRVFDVRPGMASPAFLAFRHEEEMLSQADEDLEVLYLDQILPRKLELDLDYVDHRSLLQDMKIFVRCAVSLFSPSPGKCRSQASG